MPYIAQANRIKYETDLIQISNKIVSADNMSGELNYVISKLLQLIILSIGKKYTNYNMLMGVLNCITHEFYRKQVVPYEQECIIKNGEI